MFRKRKGWLYMLKRFERHFGPLTDRLLVLAPPQADASPTFKNIEHSDRHGYFVTELQRLRGKVSLGDGAIERRHLSADGLHQTPQDTNSWHLLMLDRRSKVTACAWYLEHPEDVGIDQLRVRDCPLARQRRGQRTLRSAVESDIARARDENLKYVEVGGWAVAQENRQSAAGLILALAGYSLGQMRGGCLGITTATVRHYSSSILRRLGGATLEVDGRNVPSYFDPQYGCKMEILRFDSRRPSPRYAGLVEALQDRLMNSLLIPALAVPTAMAFAC